MSLALTSNVAILKDRASMLASCRNFFSERDVIEVDVPILSHTGSVDLHIDLIQAKCCGRSVYLHTSAEYGMKRLLACGTGDIYQLSHVFRDHERGSRHTSEFMMAEWYRLAISLEEMIEETLEFMRLFFEPPIEEYERIPYQEAFLRYAGHYPHSLEERDLLYSFEVEPNLGKEQFTIISDFPPEQAALAQVGKNGLAERFEVYYQGFELANGFHELLDPQEQRKRMVEANEQRAGLGKERVVIDEEFLAALEKGMPDSCGVAVGFDRLMMLRHGLTEIRDASSFFI